jgi:Tol biopolymer transport system component
MRPVAIIFCAAAALTLASAGPARAIQFHRLTADTTAETDPAPSPDGKTIVFASTKKTYPFYQIYVMPAQGGEWRQISSEPESTRSSTPSWSPDGSTILFVSTRGKRYNVYAIPAAGGEARRITISEGGSRFACYSPDGKQIAFYSNRARPTDLFGYNLYVVDAPGEGEGRIARQLTNSMGSPGHPVWSPDGQWLAYVAKDYDPNTQNTMEGNVLFAKYHIWKMPSKGGAEVKLTGGSIGKELVEDTWPAWHPGGRWVAFGRAVGTTSRDIWVLDLQTNKTYKLTTAGTCGKPTWSADGKSLYYTSFDGQNEDLWVATDITLPPPRAAAHDALTSKTAGTVRKGTTAKSGAKRATKPSAAKSSVPTKAGTATKTGASSSGTAK